MFQKVRQDLHAEVFEGKRRTVEELGDVQGRRFLLL
jgi:hypothetical protein